LELRGGSDVARASVAPGSVARATRQIGRRTPLHPPREADGRRGSGPRRRGGRHENGRSLSWRAATPWRPTALTERGSDLPWTREPVCHLPPSRQRPTSRGQAREQAPAGCKRPRCSDRGRQGRGSTLEEARPIRSGSAEGRSARVGTMARTRWQGSVTGSVTAVSARRQPRDVSSGSNPTSGTLDLISSGQASLTLATFHLHNDNTTDRSTCDDAEAARSTS